MKRFLSMAAILSGLLLLLGHWLETSLNLHALYPLLVLFFLGQSITIGWLIGKAEVSSDQSPIIIMGIIGFRMITGLGLLLVFYFFEVTDLIRLCVQFLVLYFVYLLFELSVLLLTCAKFKGS